MLDIKSQEAFGVLYEQLGDVAAAVKRQLKQSTLTVLFVKMELLCFHRNVLQR